MRSIILLISVFLFSVQGHAQLFTKKKVINNENFIPFANDFICFAKNNQANASSLKGYYAKVKFSNSSKEKAELFSVTAEIQQSSK